MKKIILALTLALLPMISIAQKPNLDKLPEKERNEYLLKVAYEAVMKHAPEWYRDYKTPLIRSIIFPAGREKGKLVYSVTYFNDPSKEYMECGFSILVGIYGDTGLVRDLSFGDGGYYQFPVIGTRNNEKPFYRPYNKKAPQNRENIFN